LERDPSCGAVLDHHHDVSTSGLVDIKAAVSRFKSLGHSVIR
jgi:hypothetical protein